MIASQEFKEAIIAAGLTPPDKPIGDGELRRFSSNGKPRNTDGWYVFHDDERPAGAFGCNRTQVDVKWSSKNKQTFTPEEKAAWRKRMDEAKAQRDADKAREHQECADRAASMWEKATQGPHPYAERKLIPTEGGRVLNGELLIPVYQGPKNLVGLQRIKEDGEKLFLKGTEKQGAYMVMGKPTADKPVVICEGWATGVSISMATGLCVVVAFDAGNLLHVAPKIRKAMQDAQIIIASDDDSIKGNDTGIKAATQAALQIKARIALPKWSTQDRGQGTDFNDLHICEGLDTVKAQILSAYDPSMVDNQPQVNAASDLTAQAANNPASGGAVTSQAVAAAPSTEPDINCEHLSGYEKGQPDGYEGNPEDLFIYAGTPLKTAKLFHATLPEGGRILFWRGEFYSWDRARYVVRDKVWIEQRLYRFMSHCFSLKEDKAGNQLVVRFNPKTNTVNDVINALRAVSYTSAPDVGTWLDPIDGDYRGDEIIAFQNCFLHWPTRTVMPSTDRLLVTAALEFDYDPDAGAPTEWLKFLGNIWMNDQESAQTLAEIFGYMLTDDTTQNKIFMLIGPPRSGKGTILRVLESLIGKSNRCSPSLSSLGGPFGLQSLLGKRMAMISDARLSGKADQHAIIENLLRISGDDSVDVARKNLPSLDGVTLRARFVMATNELPAFSDASSALANRFVPLKFTASFLGKEDHGLTSRLLKELSGILLWALDGLVALRERGYFVTPKSAQEITNELMEQTSPIGTFVAEKCIVSEGSRCDKDELFNAWKAWCTNQGRDHAGTKVSFGRQLSAAFPNVKRSQPTEGRTRLSLYSGIRLCHEWEESDNFDDEPF
jgi:putative DNA primase/helicase